MGFTGIILDKGTVVSCERAQKITLWDGSEGYGMVIRIRCNSHNPQNSQKNSSKKDSDKSQTSKDSKRDQIITSSTYIGESIAVDGVCLTVTDFDNSKGEFEVNIAEHTTSITTYGKEFRPDFGEGSQVNLETAYDGSVGISGHNVQGHVDCVGKILKMEREKDMLKVEFELKKEMRGLIVKKGYVSIDGVSLTVTHTTIINNRNQSDSFGVMLIPHTQQCITLPLKKTGDYVNIEADVTGKYIKSYLEDTRVTSEYGNWYGNDSEMVYRHLVMGMAISGFVMGGIALYKQCCK